MTEGKLGLIGSVAIALGSMLAVLGFVKMFEREDKKQEIQK